MEIYTIILFFFVIGVIVFALIKRNSILDIEKGRKAIFTEYCCGAINGARAKFLRLSIYRGFIVIGYARSIVIQANEIKSVSIGRYFMTKGLEIEHTRSDLPSIFLFLDDLQAAKELIERVIEPNHSHELTS